MANKKISLTYEGDSQLIDAAIEALAKLEGWTLESVESKEELAKRRVNNYVREQVTQHNINLALTATMSSVQSQSTQALDAITVALEVE
jgi:hypothetical protein